MSQSSLSPWAWPAWLRWTAVAAGVPVALYMISGSGTQKPATRRKSQPRGAKVEESGPFEAFLLDEVEEPKPAKTRGKMPDVGGPFEGFLLNEEEEEEDHRDSCNFDTFLVSGIPKAKQKAPQAVVQQVTAKAQPRPTPEMARVVVAYGTEYGFSKEIAEKLCERLWDTKKFWPVLVDLGEHPEGYDLSKEQALMVACSTQGDGVPPTEARSFCEWLFAGKAGSLGHLSFSVCALGDSAYAHFCRCGKMIDAALDAAGAKRCAPRADVDKEDWKAVNGWLDGVVGALPGLGLRSLSETGGMPAEGAAAASASAAPKRWGKARPYPATVVALQPLCTLASADDKNTVRIELDLGSSGLSYAPGDALGIYPTNCPKAVAEVLAALGCAPSSPLPRPTFHYEELGPSAAGTPEAAGEAPSTVSADEALAKCYDLRSPRPDVLQLLYDLLPAALKGAAAGAGEGPAATNGHANGHANGDATMHINGHKSDKEAPRLQQLLAAGQEEQQQYLGKRHLVDVLLEFPTAARALGSQLQRLPAVLRQLQPRLYSISSSPLENPQRVQATIAEVRYEALGRQRIGVCSTLVSARLQVGQEVRVYMHKNPDFRMPPSHATPMIMVGPGTGLAPFRAFIVHRLEEAKKQGLATYGDMALYFGCRRSDQDYLYGDVLEAWAKEGALQLHTAFSRQQAQKVYVQDRLRQSADAVWELLDGKGGHFYVCGDAGSMAGAVEVALLEIFAARLGSEAGPEAAKAYLERLSQEGRYQRDVWY